MLALMIGIAPFIPRLVAYSSATEPCKRGMPLLRYHPAEGCLRNRNGWTTEPLMEHLVVQDRTPSDGLSVAEAPVSSTAAAQRTPFASTPETAEVTAHRWANGD